MKAERVENGNGSGTEQGSKKRGNRGSVGKYEFKGSQSHRSSLVAVDPETGRTTVKWSSVKDARRPSSTKSQKSHSLKDRRPSSSKTNGGFSLKSPNKEVKEVGSPVEDVNTSYLHIMLLLI